jgi:hypothetical protein
MLSNIRESSIHLLLSVTGIEGKLAITIEPSAVDECVRGPKSQIAGCDFGKTRLSLWMRVRSPLNKSARPYSEPPFHVRQRSIICPVTRIHVLVMELTHTLRTQ